MADRMLEAKSLRRLIEPFIVIRKAYFTWLKGIARWRTMAPTPAPAARAVEGALYGGEQKRARQGPLRCDEEAFVNHGVTRMFCKLGGELVGK
jgi:hypothetical protein